MAEYLAPGVYVNEIPPLATPIRGVSTSVAAFIGVYGPGSVVPDDAVSDEKVGYGDGKQKDFTLPRFPVVVESVVTMIDGAPQTDATARNVMSAGRAILKFAEPPAAGTTITASYLVAGPQGVVGRIVECLDYSDFERAFGGFPLRDTEAGQGRSNFAHAVYGFFANGGGRCFAVRVENIDEVAAVLAELEAIDDISMLAVPGVTDPLVQTALFSSCAVKTRDRVAILDSPETISSPGKNPDLGKFSPDAPGSIYPGTSSYAAYYYPWIEAFDPAAQANIFVPPSGSIAGVYARTDATRGVYKAPANEKVMDTVGVRYMTSDAQQDLLNPQGINCIRKLDGNILVWGARVLCGNAGAVDGISYISTRRFLIYLQESIQQGTQWAVFEPNAPTLWAGITRNVSDFLYNTWRQGGLFGKSPAEAFYVKCDATTNPPTVRQAGQVVTEVGVSIVKPAEFVVFNVFQFTNGGSGG